MKARHELTEAQLFAWVEDLYRGRERKPFTHIIVDEAQDLGVPELRFLAALAPEGGNRLFFAGDLGQRIFKFRFLGSRSALMCVAARVRFKSIIGRRTKFVND